MNSAPTTAAVTEELLYEHLKWAGTLDDSKARERARLLLQAWQWLDKAQFQLLARTTFQGLRIAPYAFGETRFAIDDAKLKAPSCKQDEEGERASEGHLILEPEAWNVEKMGGQGLTWEDLNYFSQICEIAARVLPSHWLKKSTRLKGELSSPDKHLDTLNEIWWLARWRGIHGRTVNREMRLRPDSGKRIDWSFQIEAGVTINLEVKNLVRSLALNIQGGWPMIYKPTPNGELQDGDPVLKFRPSGASEINVLGITWNGEISRELESDIQEYLDDPRRSDAIDVVLVWSFGDRRRGGWHRVFPASREQNERRKILHAVLIPPDEEDHSRLGIQVYPVSFEASPLSLPELRKSTDR